MRDDHRWRARPKLRDDDKLRDDHKLRDAHKLRVCGPEQGGRCVSLASVCHPLRLVVIRLEFLAKK